jgi:hypothetical protein
MHVRAQRSQGNAATGKRSQGTPDAAQNNHKGKACKKKFIGWWGKLLCEKRPIKKY